MRKKKKKDPSYFPKRASRGTSQVSHKQAQTLSEEKSSGAPPELTRLRPDQLKVQVLAHPGGNIRPALLEELK